jgi:hypothetical protein
MEKQEAYATAVNQEASVVRPATRRPGRGGCVMQWGAPERWFAWVRETCVRVVGLGSSAVLYKLYVYSNAQNLPFILIGWFS